MVDASAKTDEILLDMRGISKSYPGVQALEDADFSVLRGEIHGLVGKNGAGKSTLMGVLMGIRDADSGSVTMDGQELVDASPQTMLDAGISYVPQHINLLNTLTVAENILVGNLPKNRFGLVDWKAVNEDSQARLSRLGLTMRCPAAGRRVERGRAHHAGHRQSALRQRAADHPR